MLAFLGFLMIFLIIYCLIQSKSTPMIVFILIPIIAAFAAGFNFVEISKFIEKGVIATAPIAILFIFSITYFGVMTDVGLFDPIINFLVKRAGTNVIFITISTGIIATIAHLDGALAATILVTVPAMLPIYKRLHIRPVVMLAIIGMAFSCMNLMPWGGPVGRVSTVLQIDIVKIWHSLIPMQIVLFFLMIAFCILMGIIERRRGAGVIPTGAAAADVEADLTDTTETNKFADKTKQDLSLKRPKLIWFNFFVTIGVIALLCFTKIPPYAAFMIGLALVLPVNFPKTADQTKRIKAHSANALSVSAILLTSGIFLGVLGGTKMLGAMATAIIAITPDFLGPFIHLILGILSVPFGMLLGTNSYFFGLLPLAIGVGEQYGITPTNMAMAMLIGKNFGVIVTPHAATTFLALGLAGVEIKDALKFCTPWLWAFSIIALGLALMIGIVGF